MQIPHIPVNTYQVAETYVQELKDLGLRATADPRNVTPPCVLLARPDMAPVGNNCANLQVDWTLHVIAKGPDQPNAWKQLDDMLTQVVTVLGPAANSITATTYPLNETTVAPSYEVQFSQIL